MSEKVTVKIQLITVVEQDLEIEDSTGPDQQTLLANEATYKYLDSAVFPMHDELKIVSIIAYDENDDPSRNVPKLKRAQLKQAKAMLTEKK